MMAGMAVVQLVAVASNALMIYRPTPIMIDPVTGAGSYLVRWAEWGSLGFLMPFLTEGMAIPLEGGGSAFAWIHAGAIGFCILCMSSFGTLILECQYSQANGSESC